MHETFVIQVISAQKSTWQGTVSWPGGKKQAPFRSALELLKLIDSTLSEEGGEFQPELA